MVTYYSLLYHYITILPKPLRLKRRGLLLPYGATLPMAGVVKCLKGYNRQLGSLGRLMTLETLGKLRIMLLAIVRELSYA